MMELLVLNCDDCGACCTHIGAPPGFERFYQGRPQKQVATFADYPIWDTVPEPLKQELGAYYRDHVPGPDSPCLWFDMDAKRCRHYEHRPLGCRDFKINGEGCRTRRVANSLVEQQRGVTTSQER